MSALIKEKKVNISKIKFLDELQEKNSYLEFDESNLLSINVNIMLEKNSYEFDVNMSVPGDIQLHIVNVIRSSLSNKKDICNKLFEVSNKLNSKQPIFQSPRRISNHDKNEAQQIFHELLDQDIIRKSNSEYVSQ